ncbi:MAG: hypothetical protein PHO70_03340 [Candidatus Omnitrophica bacterium]|nr:hypothetical protein [Candidatus Omnitrophota bacterium]
MNSRILNIAVLFCSLIFLPILHAQAFDVSPVVDGTVFDGKYPNLFDGQGDYINSTGYPQAMNMNGSASRALFEFPLSSIENSFIAASLNLTVEECLGPFPYTLGIYSYAGDGYLDFDDYARGNIIGSITFNDQSTLNYDVTSVVHDLISSGKSYVGFNIRKEEQDILAPGQPFVAFRSLEYPPSAYLSVKATPEPISSALFLLGSGALAIGVRLKKKV